MDKETVKERLRDYAEMTERAIDRYIPERECLQKNVILAARHSLTAGGKRLRPALVMEFCRVCGGEPESALPVACAIEMMHTFSLIHDDLPCMDNDDMRRGKPSCHKAFGEANALLAGDALAILPAQVIAEAGIKGTITQSAALKIIALLGEQAGIFGMIGGQVIDTENDLVSGADLSFVYELFVCTDWIFNTFSVWTLCADRCVLLYFDGRLSKEF